MTAGFVCLKSRLNKYTVLSKHTLILTTSFQDTLDKPGFAVATDSTGGSSNNWNCICEVIRDAIVLFNSFTSAGN